MLIPPELFTTVREVSPQTCLDRLSNARAQGQAPPIAFVHPWPQAASSSCGVARILRLGRHKLGDSSGWYLKVEGDVRLHAFTLDEQRIILLEPVGAGV